jgi:hypothetical protein
VDVKALVFRHNLAREAASAIGGRVDPRAFVSRFAPVRLEDVDELPLPAPVSIHLGNCAAAAGAHADRFGADVK